MLTSLRSGVPSELALPIQYWISSAAPVPLGLVRSMGAPQMPALLSVVLQQSGLTAASLRLSEVRSCYASICGTNTEGGHISLGNHGRVHKLTVNYTVLDGHIAYG